MKRFENLANNQMVEFTDEARNFYSYGSLIATISNNGNITINKQYYKYSRTTSKWLAKFLCSTQKEIAESIKSGNIKLINL
jgi:hypothetical protein